MSKPKAAQQVREAKRIGGNTAEVLDFNLFLSPADVLTKPTLQSCVVDGRVELNDQTPVPVSGTGEAR